ncbi:MULTISPECIES: hypothetical protein [Micromonospora]|uniref:Uncharacterized protein n=1 Tax=Micromonospora carbonacea TaxID=47853 RepID=A0A7H8XUD6_9ACTN|nr:MULTISPECIES: hypothetical protein [Micromonospora]MBB5829803.1 hypothetical protein [Micromonospora carbonacea]MDG4816285.1 hypothetical protein [Micromonospora sp. WMMD956]QLD28220.1 hypothetical protein HXZ27_31760 [Micromonospora carbonacea]
MSVKHPATPLTTTEALLFTDVAKGATASTVDGPGPALLACAFAVGVVAPFPSSGETVVVEQDRTRARPDQAVNRSAR